MIFSKRTFCTVTFIAVFFLLTQTAVSQSTNTSFYLNGDDHGDAYWAELAQDNPAFVVDEASLRVASANELDQLGQWSEVMPWPHIPVSAANLPDGRIVTWASSQTTSFPENDPEFTYGAVWDPTTETFIDANNPTHNMFCAANVMLEDGTVFANGGRDTTEYVSTFDYQTNSWTQIESMDQKRWYPTSVALPSGQVFTALGDGATPHPEIWTPGAGWDELSGIDLGHVLVSEYDLSMEWPFLSVAPDNSLFHAGPTPQMHSIDLIGEGSLTSLGGRTDTVWYPKDGTYVMYDEGKILMMGGRRDADSIFSSNKAMTFDINGPEPIMTTVDSMRDLRSHHSAVMLPNGEVFVVGGSSQIKKFNDGGSSLTPEVWNPQTGEWRIMADMSVPRNYHSLALLMTDGRILVGGGGLSEGQLNVNHQDVQIFTPPYLFDADGNPAVRPAINSAPATIGYGDTFTVTTSEAITHFNLIKLSSITHQMNTDLRFLPVDFSETNPNEYALTSHTNQSVLTPGYYMLFALNANGTPSEAHILNVSRSQAPQVTHPGNLANTEGELISLPITATDPLAGNLTYSADGLPNGLTIDANSGLISGAIEFDTVETHKVTVTVSNGTNQVSIVFFWDITYLLSETGRVRLNQPSPAVWHSVDFYYTYEDPVVIMGSASHNNSEPVTLRVRNVTANGFEFQLDEWDYLDGQHPTESVYYLVIEAGVYELANGQLLTAVSQTSATHISNAQLFDTPYPTPPIVLAQPVTTNENSAILAQISGVTTTQFNLYLQEEEANDGVHTAETVHWIALEPGTVNGRFEALTLPMPATNSWTDLPFSQAYSNTPVFLAAEQTASGNEPAVLRYRQLDEDSTQLLVQEELSADSETVPEAETVGYLVIEPSIFNNPFSPNALPPNEAPQFGGTAVNQTSAEGEWLDHTLTATDSDGDKLTYSAVGLPPSVTINADSGKISGPVVAGDAGIYSVTVYASDKVFSTAHSFTWTITAAPGNWNNFADETAVRLDLTGPDEYEKDIAIGDLNNDGWDDIIIVRKNAFDAVGGQADILLINENGTLTDQTSQFAPQMLSRTTDARDVALADLDGDGWLDIIIASTFADPPVLYRNQGNDAFGKWLGFSDESGRLPTTYDTATVQFCAITIGDVNGDDKPDLYFANYDFEGGAKDVLLINDGSGNFIEESQARLGDLRNSAFGTSVQIIDMNNDQKNDIVKLSAEYAIEPFNKAGIFTLFNDGDGTFTTFEEIPSNDAYMFMVGHLNGDTVPDVFIQEDAQDSIQIGEATGYSNQPLTSARTVSHGGNFRFADIDRDGDLDVGVADVDTMFPPCDTGPDSVRKFVLLQNDGDGNLSDPYGAAPLVWNQNMYDFDFIDINRDGNLDIFAAECDGYGVYMNTAVPSQNQPPILTDPADQNSNEGDSVTLQLSATDADNDALTYSVAGLPDSLTFNPSDQLIHGTLTPADAGLYIITVIVDDGALRDTAVFIWAVGDINQAPVLVKIADKQYIVGDTVAIALVASDYENDTLTFVVAGLPPSLTYNPDTGYISGQLTEADIGEYRLRILVSDGDKSDLASANWQVKSATQFIYLPIVMRP